MKVLCVDDNPLVVEALALKLRLLGGFEWLSPISHAGDLVEQVSRQHPDVVVLDLDMPGRDPLEALAELMAKVPQVRVLIFSGHTRADLVERAVDAGAWGFVSKHASVETIVTSMRRVASGEFLLGPEANPIIRGGDEDESARSRAQR